MLPKIIIGVVVLLIGLFVLGSFFRDKRSEFTYGPREQEHKQSSTEQGNKQSPDLGSGVNEQSSSLNESFYSKDGLYLTHSWPGEEHFSNEETEILIFNESTSKIEIKSFDLSYAVEEKTYPHKSGTWEKFPKKDSHDRIEYINISAQHYQDQPLILEAGQKGKLHWHIQFGSQPLDGKQTVTVKLTLLKGSETININEQFSRDSGAVFSSEEH